jgi:hypothetical protein
MQIRSSLQYFAFQIRTLPLGGDHRQEALHLLKRGLLPDGKPCGCIPGTTDPGPGTPIPNVQPAQAPSLTSTVDEPVTSMAGVPTGQNQQPFSIMPPFVAVYYLVSYL